MPADVNYAAVVVVGQVSNYQIVGDPEHLGSYAKFDVLVDEILAGQASRHLTAIWDNSTFAEPATMPTGPFLIALRRPGSAEPPVRGSAMILPDPVSDTLVVLQAACAPAFIFPSGSEEAREVQRLLPH